MKRKSKTQRAKTKQRATEKLRAKAKPKSKERPIKVLKKFIKHLSTGSLLSELRILANLLPNLVKGNRKNPITMVDIFMSGLAVFMLKYPSLLAFNDAFETDSALVNNLRTLFGVNNLSSDTHMRERLDEVDTGMLRPFFTKIFSVVQNSGILNHYQYIEGTPLLSIDGTGVFSSSTIHCKNCCVKHHADGSITYYHNFLVAAIVHPFLKVVLALMPEPIIKEDGCLKNGSEQNAATRLVKTLKTVFPNQIFTILGDSLFSTGPYIKLLLELGHNYILNAKEGNHETLFEDIKDKCTTFTMKRGNKTFHFRFVNGVSLNNSHKDLKVNFLECIEVGQKGKKKTFTWVTNITITTENIYELMLAGRVRWRIENETFNTLKNQGYHFGHNYGHGSNNLSTVFASLMMLAFLIDQLQQLCNPLFQAALQKTRRKVNLWKVMYARLMHVLLNSWDDLWNSIIHGLKPQVFAYNSG